VHTCLNKCQIVRLCRCIHFMTKLQRETHTNTLICSLRQSVAWTDTLKENFKLKVHARTHLSSGISVFILSGHLMCKTNPNFEKVRCARNNESTKSIHLEIQKSSDGLETNLFAVACAFWCSYGLFVGAFVGVLSWTTSKLLARRPHSQPVRFAPGLDCGFPADARTHALRSLTSKHIIVGS
jgi:hypothetical protein